MLLACIQMAARFLRRATARCRGTTAAKWQEHCEMERIFPAPRFHANVRQITNSPAIHMVQFPAKSQILPKCPEFLRWNAPNCHFTREFYQMPEKSPAFPACGFVFDADSSFYSEMYTDPDLTRPDPTNSWRHKLNLQNTVLTYPPRC